MLEQNKIIVPAILGPTAVGKTMLAVAVAAELGMEIVSCDSRQIYRHMNIGTAKPTKSEQASTRHWMIDILEPSQQFSAYEYAVRALEIIRERNRKSVKTLICGGTGLYFKSLSEGLARRVTASPQTRERLMQKAAVDGGESLHKELAAIDPVTANRLHPHDIQRVARALQVYYDCGTPLSALEQKGQPPDDMVFYPVVLSLERNELYRRINERVERMFEQGLWEEFLALRNQGYGPDSPGMECVGYKELFDVEEGRISLPQAVEKIKQHTRHYAKRQITWFSHQSHANLICMNDNDAYETVRKHFSMCYQNMSN